MHVLRVERIFVILSIVTLAAFFIILLTLALASDLNPPSLGTTIDPTKVSQTPPFDKPGLRQTGPHSYEAYYVGRIFSWAPATITVPAGSTVRFFITSVDVVHGFTIPLANVNTEIMPGWVSQVEHHFSTPGDYLLICNQYCGAGHEKMYAHVMVTQ